MFLVEGDGVEGEGDDIGALHERDGHGGGIGVGEDIDGGEEGFGADDVDESHGGGDDDGFGGEGGFMVVGGGDEDPSGEVTEACESGAESGGVVEEGEMGWQEV